MKASTTPVPGTVAFAMVVGPGEAEMAIDTLESVASFYPTADLWIREDRTSDATWEKLSQWAESKPVHLSRNRIVQGYNGIAKSFFDLLQSIMNTGRVPEMVIKIDPDAIMLRPGLVEIYREKFLEMGPGICGSYKIAPDGSNRSVRAHIRGFLFDLPPIGRGYDRSLRWGPAFYWKYLIRALLNGYSLGEHVLGAISAIHGETLIAMDRAGFLSCVPERHACCVRMEDVLISMGAKAMGHKLISVNDYPYKVVAWLRAFRPLGITPEEAWERNYLAVHPVKKVDDKIRLFFRERRLAA